MPTHLDVYKGPKSDVLASLWYCVIIWLCAFDQDTWRDWFQIPWGKFYLSEVWVATTETKIYLGNQMITELLWICY